jgi:hypothetical protein
MSILRGLSAHIREAVFYFDVIRKDLFQVLNLFLIRFFVHLVMYLVAAEQESGNKAEEEKMPSLKMGFLLEFIRFYFN